MEHKTYEVINCPLKPINGVFHLQQDGSFVHEGGGFLLNASENGCWEIWMIPITTRSIAHCITISASHSPVGQSWLYFSTYNDRNDYIQSSRMCLRVYNDDADDLPPGNDNLNNEDERATKPEQDVSSLTPPLETVDPALRDQVESREEQTVASEEPSGTSDTESEDNSTTNKGSTVEVTIETSTKPSPQIVSTETLSEQVPPSLSRSNSAALQAATSDMHDAAVVLPNDLDAASAALADSAAEESEMDVCPPRNATCSETEAVATLSSTDNALVSQTEPPLTVDNPPSYTEPLVPPELTRTIISATVTDKEKEKEKASSNNQHYGRQLLPVPPVLSAEQLPHYTKAIPHMNPGDLASNWTAEDHYSWTGSRTTKYINQVTHEVRTEKPMALQYHPTVCSFNLKTINRQPVEVFAPAQCIQELGGHPIKACYDTHWDRISPYWSSTVAAYEHEILNLRTYIKSLHVRQEFTSHREVEANNIIDRLEKKLEETQESEKIAQHRADTMMARSGKSYIKRDWQQTNLESTFPAGDDFRGQFSNALINFETFVCDAVNCLEDAGHPDNAAEVFVQAMKSIHEVTNSCVRELLQGKQKLLSDTFGVEVDFEDFPPDVDSVGKLFWYSTQQVQIIATIAALTESDVGAIMARMNPLVLHIHSLMLVAIEAKTIDDSADSLRIPKLVRFMLRVHAVALLSDPRCYLEPVPGTHIPYKPHEHTEILSPGVMRHGRIRENDEVEVVMCGLYFDHPSKPGAKPVIPTLVRRLLK